MSIGLSLVGIDEVRQGASRKDASAFASYLRVSSHYENMKARQIMLSTDALELGKALLPVVTGPTQPQKYGFWQRSLQSKK